MSPFPGRRLTCREVVELVTDYLEAAMPSPLREEFERHVARCEGCRAYLEQMQETIRLTGRLGEESIPLEIRDELVQAFRDWQARP